MIKQLTREEKCLVGGGYDTECVCHLPTQTTDATKVNQYDLDNAKCQTWCCETNSGLSYTFCHADPNVSTLMICDAANECVKPNKNIL